MAINKNPDAFVGFTYPPDTILASKQAKGFGPNPKCFYASVGTAFQLHKNVMNQAGAEGVLGMGSWNAKTSAGAKAFFEAHTRKFAGKEPDRWGSGLCWSGLVMLDSEVLPEKTHGIVRAGVLDDFPTLRQLQAQLAGTMSRGEQQMVAVARAMMSAPRLLLLDEPSLGLAPRMVDELLAIARRIADAGTTVLMVEQNVKKALAVADRGYVLERGTLVASGPSALLARSSVIRDFYLGAADAAPTRGRSPE